MSSSPAAWEIYRRALIPLKYGDALWEPGPLPSYQRVRPGDVGYIREGTFHLLFSAGIPLGSRVPGTDVPSSFEPLDVGPIIPRSTRPPGYLRTDTVKQVGVDIGESLAIACPVGPGAKLSFELTGEQGAVLVTNHPTYREDIERRGKFEAYIKKHYDSWKEFSQVVGHGRESPVLVTGVDLTKKFAAIAYYKNPTNVECDFSVEASDVASASASAWGSWRTLGLVHTTCGPDEYIRRTQRIRHTDGGNSSESLIPEGNDQCVLIRYYTIRKFLGFKHLRAAAGPHRLPEGDAGDGGAGIHCPGGSLSVTHNVPPDGQDSFDMISEFIFQRSDATSLLLHHDGIQDLIGENEEETVRLLEESAVVECLEVDENGVGQLVQATPKTNKPPRAAQENFAITDNINTQIPSVNSESAALPVDAAASTSGSLGVTPTNSKQNNELKITAAIKTLIHARETTSFIPAKTPFLSTVRLLMRIRETALNEPKFVGIGLSCAEVCVALDEGSRGGRLDVHSQSVLIAIKNLTETVLRIDEIFREHSQRNVFSRLLHSTSVTDAIATCERDLAWVHHVFMPTRELVSDSDRILAARNIAGMTQSSVPVGEAPPPPPMACFGREELIEEIIGHVENLRSIALIGAGGIGKTSIALAVLHHDRVKERFGDNRRFIGCDEFPASRANFLRRLSEVIGAGVENPEDLSPLRPTLSSKEILIILDNGESILDPQGDHAREIYAVVEELTQFNNVCLMITSRISAVPPACATLEVPTLSMEAARDTFNRIYLRGGLLYLVDDILKQLDFHPLSVTLLATVAHQNKWDESRLAREWEERQTSVLHVQHKSLEATIELSLSSPTFRDLGPDARELLEAIAFFPQGVNKENLEWLFPTISNSEFIFDRFCVLSLTYHSNGFVTMLAPIRDYLLPRDPKSSPLLNTAKGRYFTRLSVDINPNEPGFEDTQWIITEDMNIEHLLDVFIPIETDSDGVWGACDNFIHLLRWHKPRLTALRGRIEGLPDTHQFKPAGLFRLSQLADAVGDQTERKRLLTDCLKLDVEREEDIRVAQTLRELSDANRMLGLCGEGIRQLKGALDIFERLGDAVDQAQCLDYLARLFQRNGQLSAAEEAATRAITLLPEEGQEYLVCRVHRTLGNVHHSKGEQRKAVRHLETALEIASRFNWHHELFWTHFCLAELFLSEDEFDEAQEHIDQANLHVVEDAYNRGRIAELQANLWYSAHELEDAQPPASRALEIYEKLGAARDVESCRALLQDIEEAMEVRPGIPISDSEVLHPEPTPESDTVTQSRCVE